MLLPAETNMVLCFLLLLLAASHHIDKQDRQSSKDKEDDANKRTKGELRHLTPALPLQASLIIEPAEDPFYESTVRRRGKNAVRPNWMRMSIIDVTKAVNVSLRPPRADSAALALSVLNGSERATRLDSSQCMG